MPDVPHPIEAGRKEYCIHSEAQLLIPQCLDQRQNARYFDSHKSAGIREVHQQDRGAYPAVTSLVCPAFAQGQALGNVGDLNSFFIIFSTWRVANGHVLPKAR